ncbi:MAG: helix-turn-helix transcriptional regulator [Phycisphaeraceae bacterium]|nr:helix-turn-helix transcriptional regulator [Phycisphaeraceae bacterium]
MKLSLRDRLYLVVGRRSPREVAELTGWSGETVRRYLTGHTPSTEFLADLCRVTGTNAQWLLSGKGPRGIDEARAASMNNAELADLVVSLCDRIEELRRRVERLESANAAPDATPDNCSDSEPVVVRSRRR